MAERENGHVTDKRAYFEGSSNLLTSAGVAWSVFEYKPLDRSWMVLVGQARMD
jgi:hypothetical protein